MRIAILATQMLSACSLRKKIAPFVGSSTWVGHVGMTAPLVVQSFDLPISIKRSKTLGGNLSCTSNVASIFHIF